MSISLLSVHQAATDLLQCVCTSLASLPTELLGLAGCPCRTGVVAGAPAADNCGDGCGTLPDGQYPGQLTVNVVRTYVAELPRYTNLQAVRLEDTNCGPGAVTVADLSITLWRCAPGPTKDGCPPAMEDLADTALQTHADLLAITRAVTCCFPGTDTQRRKGRRYSLGQSTVLGPQGLCIGVQTAVTVALDGLAPPVPVAP